MKPIELIRQWADLKQVINDPAFTQEEKEAMAQEVLTNLPAAVLCTSSQKTRIAIAGALEKLYGGTQTTKKESQAEVRPGKREGSATGEVRGREPLQSTAQDARGASQAGPVETEGKGKRPRKTDRPS